MLQRWGERPAGATAIRSFSCPILSGLRGSGDRCLRDPAPPDGLRLMEQLAEIRALIARHAGGGRATPLPGLRVVATAAPTQPVNAVYEPAMAVIAQGSKRAMLGERVFDYGAGQYLIV